jgi:hypothetical protein
MDMSVPNRTTIAFCQRTALSSLRLPDDHKENEEDTNAMQFIHSALGFLNMDIWVTPHSRERKGMPHKGMSPCVPRVSQDKDLVTKSHSDRFEKTTTQIRKVRVSTCIAWRSVEEQRDSRFGRGASR